MSMQVGILECHVNINKPINFPIDFSNRSASVSTLTLSNNLCRIV
jgi:hypothetical protein